MSDGTREDSSDEYVTSIYFDDSEEYRMNRFEEGFENVFTKMCKWRWN